MSTKAEIVQTTEELKAMQVELSKQKEELITKLKEMKENRYYYNQKKLDIPKIDTKNLQGQIEFHIKTCHTSLEIKITDMLEKEKNPGTVAYVSVGAMTTMTLGGSAILLTGPLGTISAVTTLAILGTMGGVVGFGVKTLEKDLKAVFQSKNAEEMESSYKENPLPPKLLCILICIKIYEQASHNLDIKLSQDCQFKKLKNKLKPELEKKNYIKPFEDLEKTANDLAGDVMKTNHDYSIIFKIVECYPMLQETIGIYDESIKIKEKIDSDKLAIQKLEEKIQIISTKIATMENDIIQIDSQISMINDDIGKLKNFKDNSVLQKPEKPSNNTVWTAISMPSIRSPSLSSSSYFIRSPDKSKAVIQPNQQLEMDSLPKPSTDQTKMSS